MSTHHSDMHQDTERGNSTVIFLAIVAALVVCAVFFFLLLNVEREPQDEMENSQPGDVAALGENEVADMWVTYTNEEYGFTLEYPRGWEVAEFLDDAIAPTINFYEPPVADNRLPLTHHSDDVTHVSIFPRGIPTEGFFGEATETNVQFAVSVEQARDYVLADGTPFATLAFLRGGGESWSPSGFVFAHARIEEEVATCMRGTEAIPMEQCDPLTGDTMVREGEIAPIIRETMVHVLESIRFVE